MTDATSGTPLVGGLLICAFGVVIGASAAHRPMLPGWGDPLNFCLVACLYLGPIAAGFGVAHLGRLGRSGVLDLAGTAPDGRWRSMRLCYATIVVWLTISCCAMTLVVLVGVDLGGPGGWRMALLPVQGWTLVMVCGLVGAAIGGTFHASWVAPLLALLVFVVLYVLDITTGGPLDRWSPTFSSVAYRVNLVPNALLLLSVSAALVGIGLLAAAVVRWPAQQAWGGALAVAAAGMTAVAVAAHVAAGDDDTEFRTGGPARCARQAGVSLCVFEESRPQLDPMLRALVTSTEAAGELFDVPRAFHQPDVVGPSAGAAPVDVPPNVEHGGYLVRAVAALVPGQSCEASIQDYVDVNGLILERIRPGVTGPGEVAEVAREPVPDQRAWVETRMTRLATCAE